MTDSANGICDLCERTVLRASPTSYGGFLALCPDCKTSPEIVQNAPGDPGTPAKGPEGGSDELRAPESPAERLRRAADLVEQRAAAAPCGIWELTSVRTCLDPWVALMSPDLAPYLAALLRERADYADAVGVFNDREALALADVILGGVNP